VIWLEAYAVPVTGVSQRPRGAAGGAAVRGAEHVTLLGATVPRRRAAVGEA
jgi:hypothetical protein